MKNCRVRSVRSQIEQIMDDMGEDQQWQIVEDDQIFPATLTSRSLCMAPSTTTTLQQLLYLPTLSKQQSWQAGEKETVNPFLKYMSSLRQISVALPPHSLGLKLRVQLFQADDCEMGVPQTKYAQGWARRVTLSCWRVPLGKQNDCSQGGVPVQVKSLQYLNCHQNQLCQQASAMPSTLLISCRPDSLWGTLPNSVIMLPHCSPLMLRCLFCITNESMRWHLESDMGSACSFTNGQQVWQDSTSRFLYSLGEGVWQKPPTKSTGKGSKRISFSWSTFLISAANFSQKGSRYLLELTPGPMQSYGFFHRLPPEGSLMRSQPITLSSPLKYPTTFSHMRLNLSPIPFSLRKKASENRITSLARQYLKNCSLRQSSFRGLPRSSLRNSTFSGAGKSRTQQYPSSWLSFVVNSQSGKPSPQNLLEKRSWWASRIMAIPCSLAACVMPFTFSKQVQLYWPSTGSKPCQEMNNRMAFIPQDLRSRRSFSERESMGSNSSVLGQQGNCFSTTLTPWQNTYLPFESMRQEFKESTVSF